MRTSPGEPSADFAAPLAACLLVFIGLAGLGFLAGSWLMQPRVLPNVGLAAYQPPPGTRIIPLPRKMDAPELAELPAAVLASAAAEPDPAPAQVETKPAATNPPVVHKRPKPRPQPDPYSGYAYADHGRWGGGSWANGGGGWRGGGRDRW
jgi:hypothetical protein